MAFSRKFVPALALFAVGAALIFVPSFSTTIPVFFSLPLVAFWLFAWHLDARFTAEHWRLVMGGRETNVLLLALARVVPRRPALVFATHAIFSVGVAAGLQALVTHSLDFLAMSCILTVFGVLHLEALYHSRMFVKEIADSRNENSAGHKVR